MPKPLAIVLAGMILAVAAPARAQGQSVCLSITDLTKRLADSFGEAPAGFGIMQDGQGALIVFASPKGDTWTIAVLGQTGTACIIASGTDWTPVRPPRFSPKGRTAS